MDPAVILALIIDLYVQVREQTARADRAEAQLRAATVDEEAGQR